MGIFDIFREDIRVNGVGGAAGHEEENMFIEVGSCCMKWGSSNTDWHIIGVSLSEPQTSVTALHTCVRVCMLVGLFEPTTYLNFK